MGTNYYAYDKEPCSHCHREYERLHIGKSSMGWKFSFAMYDGLGLTTAKAWYEYLSKTNARIVDEYGRPETLEGLKAWVEKKQDGQWEGSMSAEEYYGDRRYIPKEPREYLDPDGYRFIKNPDFS